MKLRVPGGGLRSVLQSVSVRIALLLAVTTVLVASVMAWQALSLAGRIARADLVETARNTAQTQALALAQPLRFGDFERVASQLDLAREGHAGELHMLLVLQADGSVAGRSGETSETDALETLATGAIAQKEIVTGDKGMKVAVPVMVSGRAEPAGAVALAWSDEKALAKLARERRTILLTACGVFLGMMMLTLFLLRRIITRPLSALRGAMERVAEGDYDSPLPAQDRADEFGRLARGLGNLVSTLAKGRAAEEARMAAHEAQADVVRHLSEALDRLASGILSHRIAEQFPGEYEALRENFNRAGESLRATMDEVRVSAMNIHGNAEEIARGSDELSHRTETQAATLEQTAAALEVLLTGVREAAEATREAETNVRSAARMAEENGEVMGSAVAAMAGIAKSSNQISEIIGVIDDIAFQTNLLALNAGVEAARAGESGRGFAVVASEVRALAQRSSDAAQQIKTLISGSSEQVRDGMQLVERAGEALSEVVSKIGQISDLVSGIATVASDQAQGLNEINSGVGNLDKVTQQNAAMVEESTAAAHMLNSDAGTLSQLVERFDIALPGDGKGARSSGTSRAA